MPNSAQPVHYAVDEDTQTLDVECALTGLEPATIAGFAGVLMGLAAILACERGEGVTDTERMAEEGLRAAPLVFRNALAANKEAPQ